MRNFWTAFLHGHLVIGMLPFWLFVMIADRVTHGSWKYISPSYVADACARHRNWWALIMSLLIWSLLFFLTLRGLKWLTN